MIKNECRESPPNFSDKYISLFNHNKAHYIKMLFPYDIKNLSKKCRKTPSFRAGI